MLQGYRGGETAKGLGAILSCVVIHLIDTANDEPGPLIFVSNRQPPLRGAIVAHTVLKADDHIGVFPLIYQAMLEVLELLHLIVQPLQGAVVLDGDDLLPVTSLGVEALQDEPEHQGVTGQTAADEEVLRPLERHTRLSRSHSDRDWRSRVRRPLGLMPFPSMTASATLRFWARSLYWYSSMLPVTWTVSRVTRGQREESRMIRLCLWA